jgi:hypothetical protein
MRMLVRLAEETQLWPVKVAVNSPHYFHLILEHAFTVTTLNFLMNKLECLVFVLIARPSLPLRMSIQTFKEKDQQTC